MNHELQKTRFRFRCAWEREKEDTLRRRAESQIVAVGSGTKETLGVDTKNLREEDIMRLWSRVAEEKESECWLWQGTKNSYGYGVISINNRSYTAHRLIYLFHFGVSLRGLCVLHKCDTPLCCNPNHLFLGTHTDNAFDRDQKGRQAKGDRSGSRRHLGSRPRGHMHYAAKLTEKEVFEIRKKEESTTLLARRFGVHTSTIKHILQRRKWAHLP